jgi:hypothetical protein
MPAAFGARGEDEDERVLEAFAGVTVTADVRLGTPRYTPELEIVSSAQGTRVAAALPLG